MMQRGRTHTFRAALLLTLCALVLPSCVSTPASYAPPSAATQPRFDALAFFAGRSEGQGELSKIFAKLVPVRVQSEGVIEADGSLTLVQRIEEGDKDSRTRSWTIREAGPGRYEGTLTDAVGPVEGTAEGNRLTLRYKMDGGFRVKQVLTLAPGGQRASNRLKVSFAGITVAVLAEEIVRAQ